MKSKNVLNKVVNVFSKIVCERQEHLSQLYEQHVVQKAWVTVDDNSHVPGMGRRKRKKKNTGTAVISNHFPSQTYHFIMI